MQANVVDILVLVMLALAALHGGRKGLSGEFGLFVNVAAAAGLAVFGARRMDQWLPALAQAGDATRATLFVGMALVAYVVILMLRLGMSHVAKLNFDPRIDRPIGAVAGLVTAMVAVAFMFLAIQMWPVPSLQRHFRQESVAGQGVAKFVAPWCRPSAPSDAPKSATDPGVRPSSGRR